MSRVRSRARRLWLWGPVFAYMAAIFFVSGLSDAPLPEDVSDKTGHLTAYAGLGVLAVRAVAGGLPSRMDRRNSWLAIAIAAGYGAFDEIHQLFVAGRSADVLDWFADLTGAALGVGACWLWGIIARRHRV